MKSKLSWIVSFLLFVAIGVVLYAARTNAIFVFLYLLAIAVFFIVKTRGLIQNLILVAASLLVALCFLEIFAVFQASPPVSTTTNLDKSPGALVGHRQILGWGPTAPGRYQVRRVLNGKLIYNVVYTIDHDLFRKVDADDKGKGLVFLGDSFIFGEGVEDGDTLPQQFANLEGRKAPVYNLGFSAYSPAQALAGMRAGLYDKQFLNSRLVVEFMAPWQAERVSCKAAYVTDAPRFIEIDGQVVQKGTCRHPSAKPLDYFAGYRFVQSIVPVVRDDDIAIFVSVTKEVIRLARQKYNVPIVIYYLRDPAYLRWLHDWNDDKIVQSLRAAGASVIDYGFPRGPKYRIVGDGHPTHFENANAAAKLLDFLRKNYPNIEMTSNSPQSRSKASL